MKKSKSLPARLTAALAVFAASTLAAQTAPPAPNTPEAPIALSSFEVKSTKDTSYGATNSLAATRIARPISETPLAISVLTADFLQDTASTNSLTDAFRYVPSVVPDARSEGEARGIFGSDIGYIRGFPINAITRNGVSRAGSFSLRNVERVEILKGPVSVFFGASEPGGTVNYITKKPSFQKFTKTSLGVRSYEASEHGTEQQHSNMASVEIEHEGKLGSTAAYRVYNYYGDGHGWRDKEYKREWNLSPSVLWRPSDRFEALVEFEHARSDSNPAAQTAIVNPLYVADYANPPADILAFHNLTAAQFRANIFGSSANWWNRKITARGNTAAAAVRDDIFRITHVGEGSYPGTFYDKASFSWQGKGSYNDSESDTLTVDLTATPADWLKARFSTVHNDWTRKWIQSFRSETNGDGTFNMAAGGGDLADTKDLRHQMDVIVNGKLLGIEHQLLVGGEYAKRKAVTRNAVFDYANRFVAIPGRGGVTLTGLDAYRLWDPLLSPNVPEIAIAFNGWANPSRNEVESSAFYTAWQGSVKIAGRRLMPSVGFRKEYLKTDAVSNSGIVTPTTKTDGNALTIGAVFEVTNAINVFASYNQNYKPQVGFLATGPGVNRDLKGVLVPGLKEDLPSDNQEGKGMDVGIKLSTPNGKISATLNWFVVERDKLLAQDPAKRQADPRNTFGTFYPNPAPNGPLQFVDGIGFNPILFFSNAGLQRNEGIEFESIWAPTKRWDIVAGLDYTYTSKQVKDPSLVEPIRTLLLTRRLGNAPEWKYAVWARHRFSDTGTLGWSAGLGVRGQTSSNARFVAQDKPELLKGFTVFDTNVGYAFMMAQRRFDLSVGVTNVFDKLYITGVFAYAEPRTVSIRLSTKF